MIRSLYLKNNRFYFLSNLVLCSSFSTAVPVERNDDFYIYIYFFFHTWKFTNNSSKIVKPYANNSSFESWPVALGYTLWYMTLHFYNALPFFLSLFSFFFFYACVCLYALSLSEWKTTLSKRQKCLKTIIFCSDRKIFQSPANIRVM